MYKYRRSFALLFALLLALMASHSALAQEITPQHTDPDWRAEYWNNTTLSGTPVLVRQEGNLDHNWGSGSPAAAVNSDRFSARWTRYIDVTPGTYRFTAVSDDGVRVFVDGGLVVDGWSEHPPTTFSGTKYLGSGHHLVQVEYFENGGDAQIRVSWQQAPEPIIHWKAEFFNNMSLSGPPVLVRDDQEINFAWGMGAPAPNVSADVFSARWTQTTDFTAGNYRFRMTVDDGARLFVNGHLLIDAWKDQAPTTYTGDIYLPNGPVTMQMEYYENMGEATAKLTWGLVSDEQPIQKWKGEYFNNPFLNGSPSLVRDDADIDFNWGSGSPAPNTIGADQFSVRWTRTLDLPAGAYQFRMRVDDGGRLYVNEQRIIDAWIDQSAREYTTIYTHPGGPVTLRMEYYENGGDAVAQLRWERLADGGTTPGTVIVDDLDPEFVKGGTASGWGTAPEGYNGHLYWTQNNYQTQWGYNWGRWFPVLAPGRYEVFAYIPNRYTTTSQARYWISHAGGYTLRRINQSIYADQWVSLGTYNFRGNNQDYVSLADVTYEPYMSRLVAWDAIKWEPR